MPKLLTPKAPRPPTAQDGVDAQFFNQHSDVMRLYFSQLDSAVNALLGTRGSKWLDAPYAAVQRTTNKTFTANTATQITFDQSDYLNGCENDGLDGIAVSQSGIYNYQFSVQFANSDSQAHNAWVWLRRNGVDIPSTSSKWDIPSSHGSSDGYTIAACNFYVDLVAGDTVEMYVATVSSTVYLEAYAAQTTPFAMPAVPSVVATLSFVSNLPT